MTAAPVAAASPQVRRRPGRPKSALGAIPPAACQMGSDGRWPGWPTMWLSGGCDSRDRFAFPDKSQIMIDDAENHGVEGIEKNLHHELDEVCEQN